MLRATSTRIQLDTVTLNYDISDEFFLPGAIDGFVGEAGRQTFDPRYFYSSENQPRIAHLHGSLRYRTPENGDLFVKDVGLFEDRGLRLWRNTNDGTIYTGMITGGHKAGKLALPPYSYYFAWLAERLISSSRLLIAGYDVGDPHINVWLAAASEFRGNSDFRLVIVDRFLPTAPPVLIIELFAYATGTDSARA